MQWLLWQQKIRSTEQALRRDLALAADIASERIAVHQCLDDRLNLLASYVQHPDGQLILPPSASGFPMNRTYRAPSRVWNSQLWDGMLADGTLQHLDPDRGRELNLLYLTVRSAQVANEAERDEAPALWFLENDKVELSPDKRVELLQHISSLSRLNDELWSLSRTILRRIADLGDLPPLKETEPRLAGQYSHAMQCNYAQTDLKDRISKGWFTLHR